MKSVIFHLQINCTKSVARENLRGGAGFQNLRSMKGFCKELKGWRGLWGAAPAKFFILMLFYVFLHNFLSIFLIFNHFLAFFFIMFYSLFCQFWLFTVSPEGSGDMPRGKKISICLLPNEK